MTITYTSIDGKIFYNKDECEAYENTLHRREVFKVVNPRNPYEKYIVQKDQKDVLYVEHWDGNYREGGCTFNGTLKQFFEHLFI